MFDHKLFQTGCNPSFFDFRTSNKFTFFY